MGEAGRALRRHGRATDRRRRPGALRRPLSHTRTTRLPRAVRAALAIHEAMEEFATKVAPAYGLELRARVAVNTGPVVIPAGDAPPHVLYNGLGDTVNVAARLQALGDVVVGPMTARQVGHAFELDELGDLELKGKSDPVAAFRVTGIRPGSPALTETPFVGRLEELTALGEALAGLDDGRGAIVSVTGEPGIGKSRLVAAAEERCAGRVRFLAGHAVAYAETIPYWPVREQLRSWLGLGASDTEARVRLELVDRARRHPGRRRPGGLSVPRRAARHRAQAGGDAETRRACSGRRAAGDVLLALPARLLPAAGASALPRAGGSALVGRGDPGPARGATARDRAGPGLLPDRPPQRPRPSCVEVDQPRVPALPALVPRARAPAASRCRHPHARSAGRRRRAGGVLRRR